jgi:hypothetical protein
MTSDAPTTDGSVKTNDTAQRQDTRWWENYLVRYIVATVVGSGAVLWFCNTSPLLSEKHVFDVVHISESPQYAQLIELIVLGFAFCYIASAPILVLHALRSELRQFALGGLVRRLIDCVAFALLGLAIASLGIWIIGSHRAYDAIILAVVLSLQLVPLVHAVLNGFETVTRFASELARARADQSSFVTEYVQSYRHMREHGNAFSIIILEVALTYLLVRAATYKEAVIITVLWVAPGALAWFVATSLEFRLGRERS